jgi:23S rRNA (adenine2030-N6)-methyltransferase
MNYRHAYHAGNFADVLKHVGLVAVLLHLRKKDTPFAVIDCHGGRGLYDLSGEEAKKTGEAEAGIGRLLQIHSVPAGLQPYIELVRAFGPQLYPGSPLIAAKLLREKDRLVAIEKHPDEHAALVRALGPERRARIISGDYIGELPKLLPPTERRGVILIDPPYEENDEFAAATRALIAGHRRFANGIFLFWYPAKEKASVDASAGELLTAGIKSLLKIELDVGRNVSADAGDRRLSATGLLVVNPPFGFAETMREVVLFLQQFMAQGAHTSGSVDVLAEA